MLRSHVERCLESVWVGEPPAADADGDYPFRCGVAACFVRVERGRPGTVSVFAQAVLNVRRTSRLLVELNDINGRTRLVRVHWVDGCVVVEYNLQAKGVSRSTLVGALRMVSSAANDLGPMIAAVHGGETPFEAEEAEISEAGA